jgi:hypothetical protein
MAIAAEIIEEGRADVGKAGHGSLVQKTTGFDPFSPMPLCCPQGPRTKRRG